MKTAPDSLAAPVRFPLVFTWLLLALLAIGPTGLAAEKPTASPSEVGVQAGPAPSLTIFSTCEVTGWTEPCG